LLQLVLIISFSLCLEFQNPSERVSEQHYKSRLDWLFDSMFGVLIGSFLLIISFPLLFWNEGRSVKRHKSLSRGLRKVLTINADKVDPWNEGRLVHVVGYAEPFGQMICDQTFNLQLKALKLKRKVEMKETKSGEPDKEIQEEEGTETYTYSPNWDEDLIPSSSFHSQDDLNQNPECMRYLSEELTVEGATLGAFQLSSSLISSIKTYSPLFLTQQQFESLPHDIKELTKLTGTHFYIGKDPFKPEIGDIRISFEFVKPTIVSVVAQQQGNYLTAYPGLNGETIEQLEIGKRSPQQLFDSAMSENVSTTWVIRLIGALIMYIGILFIMEPAGVTIDVVPFLGPLAKMGSGIFAGVMAVSLTLFTVGAAWLSYRPFLGLGLMVIACLIVYLISQENLWTNHHYIRAVKP